MNISIGPQEVWTGVLVLARIGAALAIVPPFAGRSFPGRIKAVFALFLALITIPIIPFPDLDTGPMNLSLLVAKEAIMGLAIGLAFGAAVTAFQIAGSILDLSVGFSFGGVIDPLTGNNTPVLQQFYGLAAAAIFIILGGPELLVTTLVKSYELVPLETYPKAADLLGLLEAAVRITFSVAVGIATPVIVSLLLTDVAFGLVSRAVPQTQVLQFEFPVKVFVAFTLIIASLPFWGGVMEDGLIRILNLLGGGGG